MDKINLYDGKSLTDEEAIENLIWPNPFNIWDIENPSEVVQLKAVSSHGYTIEKILNPSEAVQLAAVRQKGLSLKYINNPSETVQIEAIHNNIASFYFIDNPTENVQLEAVKKDGYTIRAIKNPSEAVQLVAVKTNPDSIALITDPSEAVQLVAVMRKMEVIQDIVKPCEKAIEFVMNTEVDSIMWIRNPSPDLQVRFAHEFVMSEDIEENISYEDDESFLKYYNNVINDSLALSILYEKVPEKYKLEIIKHPNYTRVAELILSKISKSKE